MLPVLQAKRLAGQLVKKDSRQKPPIGQKEPVSLVHLLNEQNQVNLQQNSQLQLDMRRGGQAQSGGLKMLLTGQRMTGTVQPL